MPDLMTMLKVIGAIIGSIAALVAAFFSIQHFFHWFCPLRINPGINLVFDGSNPEQILATVTNISGEDQVIVKCNARNAHPIRSVIFRNIKDPYKLFKYNQHLLYGPISFEMMKKEPIRLSSKEQRAFSYNVFQHPSCQFLTSLIQIEVQLSDGRIFRSNRLEIPERWMFKPHKRVVNKS